MPGSAIYPSLKDKIIFITGGASGIGASIVRAFDRQGAVVGIIDIDSASACLLYTSPSPRDYAASRMPSSA